MSNRSDATSLHGTASDSGYSSSSRTQPRNSNPTGSKTRSNSQSSRSAVSLNAKFDRLLSSMNDVADATRDSTSSEGAGKSLGVERKRIVKRGTPSTVRGSVVGTSDVGRAWEEQEQEDSAQARMKRRRTDFNMTGPGGSVGAVGSGFTMLSSSNRRASSKAGRSSDSRRDQGSGDFTSEHVFAEAAPSMRLPPWMSRENGDEGTTVEHAPLSPSPPPPPAWLAQLLDETQPRAPAPAASLYPPHAQETNQKRHLETRHPPEELSSSFSPLTERRQFNDSSSASHSDPGNFDFAPAPFATSGRGLILSTPAVETPKRRRPFFEAQLARVAASQYDSVSLEGEPEQYQTSTDQHILYSNYDSPRLGRHCSGEDHFAQESSFEAPSPSPPSRTQPTLSQQTKTQDEPFEMSVLGPSSRLTTSHERPIESRATSTANETTASRDTSVDEPYNVFQELGSGRDTPSMSREEMASFWKKPARSAAPFAPMPTPSKPASEVFALSLRRSAQSALANSTTPFQNGAEPSRLLQPLQSNSKTFSSRPLSSQGSSKRRSILPPEPNLQPHISSTRARRPQASDDALETFRTPSPVKQPLPSIAAPSGPPPSSSPPPPDFPTRRSNSAPMPATQPLLSRSRSTTIKVQEANDLSEEALWKAIGEFDASAEVIDEEDEELEARGTDGDSIFPIAPRKYDWEEEEGEGEGDAYKLMREEQDDEDDEGPGFTIWEDEFDPIED